MERGGVWVAVFYCVDCFYLDRICSEFRLDTPDAENTVTLGSVLTPHKWHHLLITVFPSGSPQNYKVTSSS